MNYHLKQVLGLCLALTLMGGTSCTKKEEPTKNKEKVEPKKKEEKPSKPEDKKPENSGKQAPNKPEDKKPENSGKQEPNNPNTPTEKPSVPTPNTPNNNGNTGSGSSTTKPADKPSNGSTSKPSTPQVTPTPNNPDTGNNSGSTTEPKKPENTNPAPDKKENNNSSNGNTTPSTPKVTPPAPNNNGNSGSSAGGGSKPNTPQGNTPSPQKPSVYRDKSFAAYEEKELEKEEANNLKRFVFNEEITSDTSITPILSQKDGTVIILLTSGGSPQATMYLTYKGSLNLGTYRGVTLTYKKGTSNPYQSTNCTIVITKKESNSIWGFFDGSTKTQGLFRGYFCLPYRG